MAKSKYVSLPRSIRVDVGVHEHLQVMAERQHRTVSNLISLIIIEAVEKDTGLDSQYLREGGSE